AGVRERLHRPEKLTRGTHRVSAVAPGGDRRAERRHEAVAQELVDHAVVAVHDLDRRAEYGILIRDELLGRLVLHLPREVADVHEQYAYERALARDLASLLQQLVHDRGRHLLPECVDDALTLFERLKDTHHAALDLVGHEAGGEPREHERHTLRQL